MGMGGGISKDGIIWEEDGEDGCGFGAGEKLGEDTRARLLGGVIGEATY